MDIDGASKERVRKLETMQPEAYAIRGRSNPVTPRSKATSDRVHGALLYLKPHRPTRCPVYGSTFFGCDGDNRIVVRRTDCRNVVRRLGWWLFGVNGHCNGNTCTLVSVWHGLRIHTTLSLCSTMVMRQRQARRYKRHYSDVLTMRCAYASNSTEATHLKLLLALLVDGFL